MTQKVQDLQRLQDELTRAFKWMARATQNCQNGGFSSAVYDMTIALQHFTSCQHIDDKYVDADLFDSVDWKFFTNKALVMAKQELKKDE